MYKNIGFGWFDYFLGSPGKFMQNRYEITSKSNFWIRNVRSLMKSWNLDMSRNPGLVQTWTDLSRGCPGRQVFPENYGFMLFSRTGFPFLCYVRCAWLEFTFLVYKTYVSFHSSSHSGEVAVILRNGPSVNKSLDID